MKAKLILAMVLILFALYSSAGALDYRLGYDFGNPFDENNNYSPIGYPTSNGGTLNMAASGTESEYFDLEGLHFAMSGNTVHVALVNSFGLSGYSSTWNQTYKLGDIFFGFNGASTSYAINPNTGRLYSVSSYTGFPNMPGPNYDNGVVRNQVGAYRMVAGTALGAVNRQYTMWAGLETNPMQGNGDTWLMEFSFDRSLLNWNGVGSVNFHNTLSSGTDVMNKSFGVVPEPSSFLLLGLGLLGTVILLRKF